MYNFFQYTQDISEIMHFLFTDIYC